MRLVIIADLHIHPWRLQSRDGGHDRLMDGLSVLRQSLDLARAESAAWVFAGDMKQPKNVWPQDALTGVHEVLRDKKYENVTKIMVAGNHDAEGVGGSGLAPFKDCADVYEKEFLAIKYGPPNTRFIFAPWNADLSKVRGMVKQEPGAVLIAHGFLQGCMLGTEDTRIAKGTPLADYGDFSVAFFGDVHKGQWRRPADPKGGKQAEWLPYSGIVNNKGRVLVQGRGVWRGEAYYAGSAYPQNWGERDDPPKGALLADLGTGEVWLCPLKSPVYHHLELDEAGLRTFAETSVRQAYAGGFVRVVYTGKPCAALDRARELGDSGEFRSFQLIVRKPERSTARAELHAGMPMPDILRNYVAARPFSDDPRERARALEALTRLVAEP